MEKLNAKSLTDATVLRGSGATEKVIAKGQYIAKCYGKNGELKWEDVAENIVTDVGANQLLDSAFSAGVIAGPFLGLISSVGYTGVPLASDTMLSHTTSNHVWYEAGDSINYPNWSTPADSARATVTFSGATGRAKSLTSPVSFSIDTNGGTVEGCFLVFGAGAVETNDDTGGVLYSAGIFSGGAKVLGIGDTLMVSYSTSV